MLLPHFALPSSLPPSFLPSFPPSLPPSCCSWLRLAPSSPSVSSRSPVWWRPSGPDRRRPGHRERGQLCCRRNSSEGDDVFSCERARKRGRKRERERVQYFTASTVPLVPSSVKREKTQLEETRSQMAADLERLLNHREVRDNDVTMMSSPLHHSRNTPHTAFPTAHHRIATSQQLLVCTPYQEGGGGCSHM